MFDFRRDKNKFMNNGGQPSLGNLGPNQNAYQNANQNAMFNRPQPQTYPAPQAYPAPMAMPYQSQQVVPQVPQYARPRPSPYTQPARTMPYRQPVNREAYMGMGPRMDPRYEMMRRRNPYGGFARTGLRNLRNRLGYRY